MTVWILQRRVELPVVHIGEEQPCKEPQSHVFPVVTVVRYAGNAYVDRHHQRGKYEPCLGRVRALIEEMKFSGPVQTIES